tara:strand:- start:30 stop:188 length:159 start_codon:yes stop_codon:yes gene_type:complete
MKLKQNQLLLLLAVLVGLFVYHNRDRFLSKEGFKGGNLEKFKEGELDELIDY